MALEDSSVILPGTGYLYFNATAGATTPVTAATVSGIDLTAAAIGTAPNDKWVNLGHTSLENSIALVRDAEEGEVKGTYQKPRLRKMADSVTWGLTFGSVQMDNLVFDAYFGVGDKSEADVFHVKSSAGVLEGALTLILVDGSMRVPLYFPKVALSGDGEPEFGTENWIEFGIKATVLDHAGAKGAFSIFKAGLGTPVGG